MSESRRKARLYSAVSDLRKASGISTFLSDTGVTQDSTPKEGGKLDHNAQADSPEKVLYDFCRFGESVWSVGYLCDRVDDLGIGDKIPVIVIPDNSEVKVKKGPMIDSSIGPKKKKLKGLGAPTKGDFSWSFSDDLSLTSNEGTKDQTPLHIVLISSPSINPGSVNTDVVETAMNTLPTLELSRAIPYLNIEFLSSESAKYSFEERKVIKGLTTSRHLLGTNGEDQYADYITAPFLGDVNANNTNSAQEDIKFKYAGMDVFTAPQTMLPLNSFDRDKNFIDPFRPLMSVESISVTVASPPYGLDEAGCSVTANLSFILHDRSRLSDIAPLVSPGGFAESDLLKITYGYSHPDGNLITMDSTEQQQSRLYGHVIDGLRTSELFTIASSDFSMTDSGEVKITVSALSLGAENSLNAIDITSAFQQKVSFLQVQKKLTELQGMLAKAYNDSKALAKIEAPTLLSSGGSLTGKNISKEDYNTLVKYVNKFQRRAKETASGKEYSQKIGKLFKVIFDRKKGDLKEAASSRASMLKKIFGYIQYAPDPFIVPSPGGMLRINKQRVGYTQGQIDNNSKVGYDKVNFTGSKGKDRTWVSLGKVLSAFIGGPMKNRTQGTLSEIQLIFHGFNVNAGAVQDMNIASMPIEFKTLKKVLQAEFDRRQGMSLSTLLAVINENFIRAEDSPAYGISGLPSGKTVEESLALVYGLKPEHPCTPFNTPELRMSTRVFPGVKGKDSVSDFPILRIEIFDAQAGPGSIHRNLIKAAGEGGVFYNTKRAKITGNPMSNAHESYSLKQEELIKPYTSDFSEAAGDFKKTADEHLKKRIETIVKEAKFINMSKENLKPLMASAFPTIAYGSVHTGITDATVASQKDPMAIELAIARSNTRKKALDKENTSVPEPEELASEVYPVECSLKTIGCPHWSFGQQYFIDFGTGTTMDNVYTVVDVSHTLNAGEFSTDVKLFQSEGYPTLVSERSTLDRLTSNFISANKVKKSKKGKKKK